MPAGQPRKFGAFAGVFTPSILTILGVIMYMRLGWVVGQSGLLVAVGIVLLSHIISISTGLSISSIATDKKIKTGGIYYMLSRSLGLPMGGAIGITIFVGTAFSIALYIIGFCENFLGIEAISSFLGMEASIGNYRLLGSFILIFLVIIAFISTSIAIKTQFIILGAILFSLISVFLGFVTGDSVPENGIAWMPFRDGVSTITVFAIFFPAVTGFTAGVAMSGDLKNPRKDIPRGTMAAIITGLIVYLSLTIFFGIKIDREILLTDNNFLMHIAWSAPLVIAGVWGATLSSALGGILGGPRILQAISKDKITPKIFGKGYGINNEPRNALIMTFMIAEAGILIGELDMIAAIVTMFYIAAYGFINIAFALEKWASTDFRPSFRISHWVGVAGFIACFAVMFKIDTLAMIGALVVLGAIYFYIKRKKLAPQFGDVWQSVWSKVIRTILHRVDKKGLEERNWRPNVILFSGGTHLRPHLIEFGKVLVGQQGLLSNFDLILNKSSNVLFKKHQQSLNTEESRIYQGIFTRRHECKDIYEGIEAISSTYGFSGVEPNTVLLGWGRHSESPIRFVRMIKTLSDLDLNILMLDYDKELGFGSYKQIDIWCRGGGNNCNLMLSLIKFLWISEEWKNAIVRILIINPINDQKDRLIRDAEKFLENIRMDAEIKVLNNQVEQRPAQEIIQVESSNSDLVMIGIPEVKEGEEFTYVENVNRLCHNIGTVLLVKASSYFKEIEIGTYKPNLIQQKSEFVRYGLDLIVSKEVKIPGITYPGNPVLAEHVNNLYSQIKLLDENIYKNILADLFSYHNHSIRQVKHLVVDSYGILQTKMAGVSDEKIWNEENYRCQNKIILESGKISQILDNDIFPDQRELMAEGIRLFSETLEKIINNVPETIENQVPSKQLKLSLYDNPGTLIFKIKANVVSLLRGNPYKVRINYSNLVSSYFEYAIYQSIYELLENWGMISLQYLIKVRKLNESAFNTYIKLDKILQNRIPEQEDIEKEINKTEELYADYSSLNEASLQSLYRLLLNKTFYIIQQISNDLNILNINSQIRKRKSFNNRFKKLRNNIFGIPELWYKNQLLLSDMNRLELSLNKYVLEIRFILIELHDNIDKKINQYILAPVLQASTETPSRIRENPSLSGKWIALMDREQLLKEWKEMLGKTAAEIMKRTDSLPETNRIMQYEVYENFKTEQFSQHKPLNLLLKDFSKYYIETDFLKPVISNIQDLMTKIRESSALMIKLIKVLETGNEGNPPEIAEIERIQAQIRSEAIAVDKLMIKHLNRLMERRNALTDYFALSSIIRKLSSNRKFLKK